MKFDIDMSFSEIQIQGMLREYSSVENIDMNIKAMGEILHYYTNGYPFFVSRLCEIIHENLFENEDTVWNENKIKRSVKYLLSESNTLFDDLIKNIENNKELQNYIFEIIMNNADKSFNIDNPIINMGFVLGYFKNVNEKVRISNRIFEQRLYNYFTSKLEDNTDMSNYNFKENFVIKNGLNFEKILLKFQQFIKEQYSSVDSKFIEREGRLLFLAFIKPIINEVGFDFKEAQISEEKRIDIIIYVKIAIYIKTRIGIWVIIKKKELVI